MKDVNVENDHSNSTYIRPIVLLVSIVIRHLRSMRHNLSTVNVDEQNYRLRDDIQWEKKIDLLVVHQLDFSFLLALK